MCIRDSVIGGALLALAIAAAIIIPGAASSAVGLRRQVGRWKVCLLMISVSLAGDV